MKYKKLIPLIGLCAGSLDAASYIQNINVSQDNFIDELSPVQGAGGTSAKLSIATPNGAGAWQYTRKAYFGFDITGVDLAKVQNVTFNALAASDIVAAYNGNNVIRFYLVNNNIADAFDETTIQASNAPGDSGGNVLTAQRTNGTIIGDVAVANPAANQAISLDFSAASLADVANDTNQFLTVVAEYRGQNNNGFGPQTGLGFNSKESVAGGASLIFTIPEPSSMTLLGIGALGLVLRRRR